MQKATIEYVIRSSHQSSLFYFGIKIAHKKLKRSQKTLRPFMEAPTRFELVNKGFADLCLTTWLWRQILRFNIC